MLASVRSAGVIGIEGYGIQIEVDVAKGLPQIAVVGLPDAAVKESKDRVHSAIKNSGFPFPSKRITINLAPADTKKEGSAYDLPIALGILAAGGIVAQENLHRYLILGELSLDGTIKPVKGILSMMLGVRSTASPTILPQENAQEAAVVSTGEVFGLHTLAEAVDFINGTVARAPEKVVPLKEFKKYAAYQVDMADVKGQAFAKRALEVAVAGHHNILLVGSPGSGKTMLAKRIPTILPAMSMEEGLETTTIYSISGLLPGHQALIATRPFRSPHHTTSDIALIGGGSNPKPGEVSLAHNGVLFLDELPEFQRKVLESLRQPIEDGVVTVARAARSVTFPSRFMLVCAMNPCPCGYYTHPTKECRCNPGRIEQYRAKISGPLLDRIDIHIEVPPVNYKELMDEPTGETSAAIQKRVNKTRALQRARFKKSHVHANASMTNAHIRKFCALDEASKRLLKMAVDELGLSGRAYDKLLKVARTIADMADKEQITQEHIAEAIQYRSLDRSIVT